MKHVCVLGLGYIGLPTAALLASAGYSVDGVDTNPSVVEALQSGRVHIAEQGLLSAVRAAIESGNLRIRTAPVNADVFLIAVPTPLKEQRADLRYVESAADSVSHRLAAGNLVILESTVPPGTTAEVVAPILERSGLRAGVDFHLAYCPERVLPGKILKELVENDRIIGGLTPESAVAAREFYRACVKGPLHLTDANTAELVKVVENASRDLSIAFSNELARICMKLGIDVWTVIELANHHPRVNLLSPGPGVGGHCLPIDPWFIVEKAPELARLIRVAREINDEQPGVVVQLVRDLVENDSNPRVAILGIAYKADIDDARESPGWAIVDLLEEAGYSVAVTDPLVDAARHPLLPLEDAVSGSDCLVLVTNHHQFADLDPLEVGPLMRHRRLVDTRGVLDRDAWRNAGFETRVLGRP
jgi:UDP-N-acetyl-D-mannosaminuronic acid dehydrogenase